MPNKNYLNPVIITGCQRSGTTLLRTILGRHPQLLEHPDEPQFFLELYQRFGNQLSDVSLAVAYLRKHPYLPASISSETLKEAFNGFYSLSLSNFIQKYILAWGGNHLLNRRPILKDPFFIFHLDLVATIFPDATFIHVIRDPRGNVSSQRARWPQFTVWECTKIWKKAVALGRQWRQSHPHSTVEVVFEKLLMNPEPELTQLCQFLGVPFEPSLLSFKEITTIYAPESSPKQVILTGMDANKALQWQHHLSMLEISMIENACKIEMGWWDYEFVHPRVTRTRYLLRLWYEKWHYLYKVYGRRLKALLRKIGWQLGIGILKVPPKK